MSSIATRRWWGRCSGHGEYDPAGAEFEIFDTPTVGAHTYAVKAFVSTGTLTVNAGAGGSGNLVPGHLRVTKA